MPSLPYDATLQEDLIFPKGRTIRGVAADLGLYVPEPPGEPPTLVGAGDKLYAVTKGLRETIETWHQKLLAEAGPGHPWVMAATVILATPEWTALAPCLARWAKQREMFDRHKAMVHP